jgi:hypothetical protein
MTTKPSDGSAGDADYGVIGAGYSRYRQPDTRIGDIRAALGRRAEARPVPIPLDCADGFNEAYYGRPERLLDPGARLACSGWSFVDPALVARLWDRKYGHLRNQPQFDGPLRLIVG